MKRKRIKKGNRLKENIYVIIIGMLIIVSIYVAITPRITYSTAQDFSTPSDTNQPEIVRIYHVHADFLVFVNGNQVNFNRPEFDYVDRRIHLHIPNYMGDHVIHIESQHVTMGDFFYSLGMKLNVTCFVVNDNEHCNNNNQKLKMYINGIPNSEFDKYKPQDLDRILITYGDETESEISEQINSVTNLACIFSQKCAPPPEAENRILYN